MKRTVLGSSRWILAATVLGVLALSGYAQDRPQNRQRPGARAFPPPSSKGTVSPYINLLSNNQDPALVYMGIIKPQLDNYRFQKFQQEQISTINQSIKTETSDASQQLEKQQKQLNSLQAAFQGRQQLSARQLTGAGHRGSFMQHSRYFPRAGAGGGRGR